MQNSKLIKIFLFFLFLIVFGQWVYSIGKILIHGTLFDFGYYIHAVQNYSKGLNPYFVENFAYPPPVLFIFYPLSRLPIFWSQIIWTFVSLSSLIFSLKYIFKVVDWKPTKNEILIIFSLSILSFPVRWTFGLGQINFLVLFFIVLTYYFSIKNKNVFAGICLGISVILKMTPLLLLFYFLIKRRFKIIIAALITIVSLLIFSGLIFGFDLVKEYLFVVIPRLFDPLTKHGYYNQAFSSLSAGLIFDKNILTSINFLFAGILLVIDFFVFRKKKKVDALDYSLAIITMLLVNGFSWQHHFVLLLFPFLVLVNFFLKFLKASPWRTWRILLLLALYVLVSFNFKNQDLLGKGIFATILLSHVFWGALLLWILIIFMIKNEKVLH